MRTSFVEIGRISTSQAVRPTVLQDNKVRFAPTSTTSNIGASSYGVTQTTGGTDSDGTVITFANPGTYWIQTAVYVVIPTTNTTMDSRPPDGNPNADPALGMTSWDELQLPVGSPVGAALSAFAGTVQSVAETILIKGKMFFGEIVNGALLGSTKVITVHPLGEFAGGGAFGGNNSPYAPDVYTNQFSIKTTTANETYYLACFQPNDPVGQFPVPLVNPVNTATPMQFSSQNMTPTGSSILNQPASAELIVSILT